VSELFGCKQFLLNLIMPTTQTAKQSPRNLDKSTIEL